MNTLQSSLNFNLVLANLIVSIKMFFKKQLSQKSCMEVFKVKIVCEGNKIWNNLPPPTLFWNYMVAAKQRERFFQPFCNLLRVSKLYQSRLFSRDFSYCAYRCTMPGLFIIIGKSVTLLLKWLSFFCKGNRRSPQPLSLLEPRSTGIQAASWQSLGHHMRINMFMSTFNLQPSLIVFSTM